MQTSYSGGSLLSGITRQVTKNFLREKCSPRPRVHKNSRRKGLRRERWYTNQRTSVFYQRRRPVVFGAKPRGFAGGGAFRKPEKIITPVFIEKRVKKRLQIFRLNVKKPQVLKRGVRDSGHPWQPPTTNVCLTTMGNNFYRIAFPPSKAAGLGPEHGPSSLVKN